MNIWKRYKNRYHRYYLKRKKFKGSIISYELFKFVGDKKKWIKFHTRSEFRKDIDKFVVTSVSFDLPERYSIEDVQ